MKKNDNKVTLNEIKNNPKGYKVCKLCTTLNLIGRRNCHNCNHKLFNEDEREVLFKTHFLYNRYSATIEKSEEIDNLEVAVTL